MRLLGRLTAEAWLTMALFVAAVLGLAFSGTLVAAPKLLFGRALSAISPSLFPKVVLAGLAVAAGALLLLRGRALVHGVRERVEHEGLGRALLLFAIMLFYALTMVPLGFFVSSALSLGAISVAAGNRSVPAILAIALLAPIGLYLVSTRGLAVSLPELDAIEMAWSRAFSLLEPGAAPPAGSP